MEVMLKYKLFGVVVVFDMFVYFGDCGEGLGDGVDWRQ